MHHNSSTKPGHTSAQIAPTSYCTTLPCDIKLIQDHKIQLDNDSIDNRGVTGRAAGFRRARRRPVRMADNPSDPHWSMLILLQVWGEWGAMYEHLRVVPPGKRLRVPSCTRPDILGSG